MLNFFKKKPIMEFYCAPEFYGVIPEPRPAFKHIPEWFKKIPTRLNQRDQFGAPTLTAKQCMPMLDAMCLGYVIPLQADLTIKTNQDLTTIETFSNPQVPVCEFHDIKQLGEKTAPGFPAPPVKFINHWVIKTAPGWSTMIMPLVNHFGNKHFTCLSGLVDTDTYAKEINFPAVWHTPNFDDRLPAGTPLVVVFPVKRSAIAEKPVVREMTEDEFKFIEKTRKQQATRLHVYTNELREPRK